MNDQPIKLDVIKKYADHTKHYIHYLEYFSRKANKYIGFNSPKCKRFDFFAVDCSDHTIYQMQSYFGT